MKKISILLLIFAFSVSIFAQKKDEKKTENKTTVTISKTSTPMELAKAALLAHGGDKFKAMKTLVVRGSAEISGSPTQVIPATFAMILAGEKYRLEITNPFQPFKQVYDGENTVSSVPNFTLPPLNRLGLPLLPKIEEKGYVVAVLPEGKNKKLGFRITSPEGYYTDFFLEEKTAQVKSYESSYEYNGRNITTSVEIDKVREVEGVIIPERYAQRFDLGQLTMYSDFKAKEILVNSAVADEIFTMK